MMDTQTQAKRIGFLNAVFAGKSVSAGTVARVWAQGGGENARKTPPVSRRFWLRLVRVQGPDRFSAAGDGRAGSRSRAAGADRIERR